MSLLLSVAIKSGSFFVLGRSEGSFDKWQVVNALFTSKILMCDEWRLTNGLVDIITRTRKIERICTALQSHLKTNYLVRTTLTTRKIKQIFDFANHEHEKVTFWSRRHDPENRTDFQFYCKCAFQGTRWNESGLTVSRLTSSYGHPM